MTTIPCIVDNQPFKTPSTYDVLDPADRTTVLHNVSSLPVSSVNDVVASSERGLAVWRDMPFTERRKVFYKAQQLFNERIPTLIDTEATETTAGQGFAGFDVAVLTAATLEETTATMSTALRGELAPCDPSGKRMAVIREPYGVVLSIVPWNAPSTLCMRALANPLAGGNAVILKTSEFSPKTHGLIAQLFLDAGLPPGVLNVVNVSTQDAPNVIKALIEHPSVRKVNFTGSTRVGRLISQTCAANLKPVVLELGGKAPAIVLDDADIDLAANAILFGGLLNQGQICMSTASVLVHKSASQALGKALNAQMQQHAKLFQADATTNEPMSPDVQDHRLRGLFTTASADRVRSIYDDAVKAGAKVVAGTPGFDAKLGVVQPAFVEATTSMQLYSEELFAPLIGIYTFDSDEEAVKMANAPGAGLSASVFSRNESRAWKIARGIESGAVHINSITIHDSQEVPHGGVKTSGDGRFNGVEGIRAYLYQKVITISPGVQLPFFAL